MTDIAVSMEDDAVPFVRIMAARFRRATLFPAFADVARKTRGKIGLRSAKDPQALTVSFEQTRIRLSRGIADDADLVITLDLDTGKPVSVKRWWRHPLLAFRASTLFDDYRASWQSAAKTFWSATETLTGMPAGIHIKATDHQGELALGDSPADVRIEGRGADLAALFGGDLIFVDAVMRGRIRTESSMKHIAVLSDATKLNLLGEL